MKLTQALLVIRLSQDLQADEYWWLPTGAPASNLTLEQAASFSKTSPALVLLDAAAIRLDEVTLPPGVKVTEAALLLEDQICQPIEDVLVLELDKKGRQVKLATLDKQLAEDWRQRLADKNIQVARWVPEALCLTELWQQSEQLLLVDEYQAKLWNSEEQTLLSLPLAWLNSISDSTSHSQEAAPLLAADAQQINVKELPQKALVPWLATAIPAKINLWPESLLASWFNKLPIKQLKKSLQLTPKQWLQASPWLLLVLVLLVQQGVNWLAKPASSVVTVGVDVRQEVQVLDQRLDRYTQHLYFQQQRLDVWQNLLSRLQSKQHIRVAAIQLDELGITAELVGVKSTDQSALRNLDGRWRFTEEKAVWELKL